MQRRDKLNGRNPIKLQRSDFGGNYFPSTANASTMASCLFDFEESSFQGSKCLSLRIIVPVSILLDRLSKSCQCQAENRLLSSTDYCRKGTFSQQSRRYGCPTSHPILQIHVRE